MIDHVSAAAVVTAATRAHEMVTAQIVAEPHGPIVADLERIADELEALSNEYAHMIRVLGRRNR